MFPEKTREFLVEVDLIAELSTINPITYIAMETPHRKLKVQVDFEVDVAPPPDFDIASSPAWETIRDDLKYAPDAPAREASVFAFASLMIPPLPALKAYAAP